MGKPLPSEFFTGRRTLVQGVLDPCSFFFQRCRSKLGQQGPSLRLAQLRLLSGSSGVREGDLYFVCCHKSDKNGWEGRCRGGAIDEWITSGFPKTEMRVSYGHSGPKQVAAWK